MSEAAVDRLPTTKEELNRKCVDMLTDLAHGMEQDHIEPTFARLEAHVIWKLTAGLVDSEISNMAEQLAVQASEAARNATEKPERVYLRNAAGEVARISYPFSKPGFSIDFFGDAAKKPITGSTPAGPERRAQLKTLTLALIGKGYRPI